MLTLIEAPRPFITLEEVKAGLVIETSDHDFLLNALIMAACGALDGPQSWTQRALAPQVWQWRADGARLDGDCLPLPLMPLIGIESVTVKGEPFTDFEALGEGAIGGGYLKSPSRWFEGDLVVTFKAGYPDIPSSPPESGVPQVLRTAAVLVVGDLFKSEDEGPPKMSPAVEALVGLYRCWRS